MCTMTWWRQEKLYGVYFNRDEMKTRPRAEPPSLRENRFLAPLDPTGGGTWISVNRSGLIVALLNRWHDQKKAPRSRGKLVWDLSKFEDSTALEIGLSSEDLRNYPSFTLIALDASRVRQWDWNGKTLSESPASCPVSSSSFDTENILSQRAAAFQNTVVNPNCPNQLQTYHSQSSHNAYSTRMCRPDAQTWSRSSISVSPKKIQWDYLEEFLDHQLPPKSWHADISR